MLFAAENYQLALAKFSVIAETSRIDFNVGLIHATLGSSLYFISAKSRAIQLNGRAFIVS